ncbi:MAG: AarF/UbiB family protein [Myxococcales bacterium]|nr:AarF/UbiB family protein [Myxococcales bacterium]
MALSLRLARALLLVWLIFFSYALQFTTERLFSRRRPGEDGTVRTRLPGWLRRRRQRVHERNADRLLGGILKLHGVYVKLGQVLSILVGILPRVYRQRLSALQDQVPPRPFAELERSFRRSLGKAPGECFERIEEAPIAAASLGQVHRARLQDGREVAVKLLYPGIRELIAVDMRVLRTAMWLFSRFLPIKDLQIVHDALVDLLARETDYLHEADCMERMAENFRAHPDLLFPSPLRELSSGEVLTMSFMEGIKISDLEQLRAAGIDPDAVGRRLLQSFFEQLFLHRYFHADPHPGNFLVQPGPSPTEPRLVVLDFGAISEAPQGLIDGLTDALVAFFERDGSKLLEAFERMGFVTEEADRALVEQTVLMYFERLLSLSSRSPQALMSAKPGQLRRLLDPEMELRQLRELARSFTSPPGWFYIERALVMLFGLCGEVAPELDMLKVGFPYVMPLLQARTRSA